MIKLVLIGFSLLTVGETEVKHCNYRDGHTGTIVSQAFPKWETCQRVLKLGHNAQSQKD